MKRAMETTIDTLRRDLEIARAEASRARREARADDMTGLGNRRLWRETTEELQRLDERFAVILFDVANLHAANHVLGHEAADDLLREIASAVRGDRDLVFRLGGDEFAVVISGMLTDTAERIRDRIEQAVGEHEVAPGVVVFLAGAVAIWAPGEDLRWRMIFADRDLEMRKAVRKRELGVPTSREATLRGFTA